MIDTLLPGWQAAAMTVLEAFEKLEGTVPP
jgi:hypothetical protein